MQDRPKHPALANIVFLDKVGETLREATKGVPREELPEEIVRLLRRLERREVQEARKRGQLSRLRTMDGS